MPVDKNNLNEVFTYHSPTGDQPARYANIRKACMAAAEAILENAPQCADQQAAIRHIREGMMTANMAIATGAAV